MAYRRYLDDDDDTFSLDGNWGSKAARSGFGRIEPDERLEASREAWRRGASYEELFGTDPLELKARVGDDGENHPSDVAKIEALLDRRGFYDVQSTDGPTGLYSSMLGEALEKFQAAAQLKVDGFADPGGETITSLSAGLRPAASARSGRSIEAPTRDARTDQPTSRVSQADPIQDHVDQSVDRGTSTKNPRPGGRAPQLGERVAVLPAPALTRDTREEFEQRTGVKLTKTKGGHALIDPTSGGMIAEFPDDVAEEFVRDWKWFSDRIDLLWVVHRPDLTRDQKLSVVNRLLVPVNREEFGIESLPPGDARKAAERTFNEEHDRVETLRQAAHEALDAMEQGRPKEHILSSLQEKVFPDLLGFDRSVREFALDVAPGLGSLRSALHFKNGFVRLREAIEDGDWSRAGDNGFMMLLDLGGLWPGANVAKPVARGVLRVAPHGRAIEASAEIWRMGRQWKNLRHPVNPGRLFGKYLNELSPEVQQKIMRETRWAFGRANERHLLELARQIDPTARKPDKIPLRDLGLGRPGSSRTYDLAMMPLPHKLWADVMTGFAQFTGKPLPKPQHVHYEAKAGAGERTAHQTKVDNWVNQNLDKVTHLGIAEVRALRAFPHQIPIKFVIEDMGPRFRSMIDAKVLDSGVADTLMHNMKLNMQSGVAEVSAIDYIALLTRLAATGVRNVGDSSNGGSLDAPRSQSQ